VAHDKEPRQLSFKGRCRTMTAFQDSLRQASPSERSRLIAAMLKAIASHSRVEIDWPGGAARQQATAEAATLPQGARRKHASGCCVKTNDKSLCHSSQNQYPMRRTLRCRPSHYCNSSHIFRIKRINKYVVMRLWVSVR